MDDPVENQTAPSGGKWSSNKLLVAAIPASVSLICAIYAGVSASNARADADKLADQRLSREERMKVYERVEAQLGSESPHGIMIASAYTRLIQDGKVKRDLCELINVVAIAKVESAESDSDRAGTMTSMRRVARETSDCAEELNRALAAFEANRSETGHSASASQLEQTAQSEAPAGEVLTPHPNAQGWDIDVFSCEGRGDPSRELAKSVADRLAGLAKANRQIGEESLGRIRLRHASRAAQNHIMSGQIGNAVIASADERPFAEALAEELKAGTAATHYRLVDTAAMTRWYISIWTCDSAG